MELTYDVRNRPRIPHAALYPRRSIDCVGLFCLTVNPTYVINLHLNRHEGNYHEQDRRTAATP